MTLTISELRANLRSVIEKVKAGEEVSITQNGEWVASIVHPSKLPLRVKTQNTKAADDFLQALYKAKAKPRSKGITKEQAEKRVKELRVERDAWP